MVKISADRMKGVKCVNPLHSSMYFLVDKFGCYELVGKSVTRKYVSGGKSVW